MLAQRLARKANGNAYTKKYEKTFNGFIMRMYRNMKSRIVGIQYKKAHLYLGKDLLKKEDFYKIAKSSRRLRGMFYRWKKSGFNRRLTPSVDRINPEIGYTADNIQWLIHAENSGKTRRK